MLTRGAWLEPLSAVLRVGSEGAVHGDPYEISATVRYIDIDKVEIVGLVKYGSGPAMTRTDLNAIFKTLFASGVTKLLVRRIIKGRKREKWIDISKKIGS